MEARTAGDEARTFRILSLDGGGIRGAFTAGFLAAIEERIGRPLGQCFDLIAGTSTGGIIAAAIAFGEPATRIEQFYLEHGPRIFARPWKTPTSWYKGFFRWLGRLYPGAIDRLFYTRFDIDHHWFHNSKYLADELKSALNEVFGDKLLGHAKNRLVIPSVNAISGQPKVFKTSHFSNLFIDHRHKVVDVLLATSAAPTYFPAAVLDNEPGSAYVDGGLWANNPSVIAIVESMMISERCNRTDIDPVFSLETTHMLSVGTGKPAVSTNPPGTKAGIYWWMANKLLDLSSLSQSKGVDFQAKHILNSKHHRIEFDLAGPEWTLDNVSLVENMVHLGRQRGIAEVENLRKHFFIREVLPFVPFELTPALKETAAQTEKAS